jgi:hypothetical protein
MVPPPRTLKMEAAGHVFCKGLTVATDAVGSEPVSGADVRRNHARHVVRSEGYVGKFVVIPDFCYLTCFHKL